MKKLLVLLIISLFLLVLAAPVLAGGNGNEFVTRDSGLGWGFTIFPICSETTVHDIIGIETDMLWESFEKVKYNKDGLVERYQYHLDRMYTFGPYVANFTSDRILYQFDLSVDGWKETAENETITRVWSDTAGVYATGMYSRHSTWNLFGELTSESIEETVVICLRTTLQ